MGEELTELEKCRNLMNQTFFSPRMTEIIEAFIDAKIKEAIVTPRAWEMECRCIFTHSPAIVDSSICPRHGPKVTKEPK